MSGNADFAKDVLRSCESALVSVGFRKIRQQSVVYNLSSDFLGWVGLNYGYEGSAVRINPFVGVHCIPMMRLIEELSGFKYQLGRHATYAVHLMVIDQDVAVFDFLPGDDLDEKAKALASVLIRVAVPFMEEFATLDALLPVLRYRVPELGGFPQRVAVTLYLMGDREGAASFVKERRAEYADDEEVVREHFDRFAIPFLRLLAGESSD